MLNLLGSGQLSWLELEKLNRVVIVELNYWWLCLVFVGLVWVCLTGFNLDVTKLVEVGYKIEYENTISRVINP